MLVLCVESNSLARQWGIDREPCFWPTSAAEAKLRGQAPGTYASHHCYVSSTVHSSLTHSCRYLVRPSSQEGKMTLAVVSLDGNIERFLFSMVRPGYWMCGVGAGAEVCCRYGYVHFVNASHHSRSISIMKVILIQW